MTNTSEFISRAETDLRTARQISEATKAVFAALPPESQSAFQRMLAFAGCQTPTVEGSHQTSPQDRANAVALMFLKLEIDTHDPKWSSWVLERLLEAVLTTPQGTMTDLFRGFDLALKKNAVHLTETVVNLVKEVVVTGFTKHKAAYQQANWGWANEELARGASPARCYLFLHALPPDKASPAALVSILRGLERTSQFGEAVDTLSDDLERADVKPLLRELKPSDQAAADKIRPYL